MLQRVRILLLGFALAVTPAAALASGLPSVANSTIPPCIYASPDGNFVTQIVLRDITNVPIAGANVTLDFSGCATYLTCSPPCNGCTGNLAQHKITAVTNAFGVANFDLRVGGVCPNETVSIIAVDVLPMGTRPFASLDQTGDLYVTTADVIRVSSLVGSHDTSANFDCSGTVNNADVALVQQHSGATCTGVVAAPHRTWGRIKSFYR
jgi:hypothetical protein